MVLNHMSSFDSHETYSIIASRAKKVSQNLRERERDPGLGRGSEEIKLRNIILSNEPNVKIILVSYGFDDGFSPAHFTRSEFIT